MQGAANLSSLNRLVVRTYDSLGMQASQRIKHLKLTDLQATTNEYPCLKHVKGAKIRWFTPVCLEICKMYATTKEGKHRKACVQALHEMYLLLQKDWKEWGPACGAAFTKHGEDMLSHYSWLAGASADAGKHMHVEHGSKTPCAKPPARTKHAPAPSWSLVLWQRGFHVHICAHCRQLCQRHSQP